MICFRFTLQPKPYHYGSIVYISLKTNYLNKTLIYFAHLIVETYVEIFHTLFIYTHFVELIKKQTPTSFDIGVCFFNQADIILR